MINIKNLVDDQQCFATVRRVRWPVEVTCAHCYSIQISRRGKDDRQKFRQRYHCNACDKDFDDLTNTIFAGRHQPLKIWILCLYFMGLNLSNSQIAKELELNKDDVQAMTTRLRAGVEQRREAISLSGDVECDEVYIVAGHKGKPDAVKKREEKDDVTG